MDKKEIEKLMDKYKREMLEFSKRNNLSGYPSSLEENENPVERDRSDPLSQKENASEETPAAEPVISPEVQTEEKEPVQPSVQSSRTDVISILRDGCRNLSPEATNEQRARCKAVDDFLFANPESGTLRVEAYASDRAFGIQSARVMVFLPLPSGNVTLYDGLTDIDGISRTLVLPAPPKSLSQTPQNGKNPLLPYALYSVYVEHPMYVRSVFTNVPVFSGVESVQPVRMLAKAPGLQEPEPIVVDETAASAAERQG